MKKQVVGITIAIILCAAFLVGYMMRNDQVIEPITDSVEQASVGKFLDYANGMLQFSYPSNWSTIPDQGNYNHVIFKNENNVQVADVTCPIREIGYEVYKTVSSVDKIIENNETGYIVSATMIHRERLPGTDVRPTFSSIYFNGANYQLSCEINIYTGELNNSDIAKNVFDTLSSHVTMAKAEHNLISRKDWGMSFVKPEQWDVVETSQSRTVLKRVTGEYVGDVITVTYYKNTEYLMNTDNKFGSVTYFWNPEKNDWFFNKDAGPMTNGVDVVAQIAIPKYRTAVDKLPVFQGTERWLTEIVPLDNYNFVVFNISGSGETETLRNLVQTIKRI